VLLCDTAQLADFDAAELAGPKQVVDLVAAECRSAVRGPGCAPLVAECPIQLECELVSAEPFNHGSNTAHTVRVLRSHADEQLIVPGTEHIDPLRWDPLIMKFCDFFGGGSHVRTSRLPRPGRYLRARSPDSAVGASAHPAHQSSHTPLTRTGSGHENQNRHQHNQ
jgi:hypothetical protein